LKRFFRGARIGFVFTNFPHGAASSKKIVIHFVQSSNFFCPFRPIFKGLWAFFVHFVQSPGTFCPFRPIFQKALDEMDNLRGGDISPSNDEIRYLKFEM
jgi:hypothetical protein